MLRLAVCVLVLLAVAGCEPRTWEYRPVVQTEAGLAEDTTLLTDDHVDRAMHVLIVNGYAVEQTGPTTLVVEGARPSDELVWNVTTKAEDPVWLREHPLPLDE